MKLLLDFPMERFSYPSRPFLLMHVLTKVCDFIPKPITITESKIYGQTPIILYKYIRKTLDVAQA